jgi:hypothetical protein
MDQDLSPQDPMDDQDDAQFSHSMTLVKEKIAPILQDPQQCHEILEECTDVVTKLPLQIQDHLVHIAFALFHQVLMVLVPPAYQNVQLQAANCLLQDCPWIPLFSLGIFPHGICHRSYTWYVPLLTNWNNGLL